MRVNRHRPGQLTIGENLYKAVALSQDATAPQRLRSDLRKARFLRQLGDAVEPKHEVLHAEDVGEATLRQTAVQRHLSALKAAHQT